jgi:DnaJ-domain-containing protein 1
MIARASRIVPVWFVAACLISIQHGESSVAAFATPSQYPTRRMGLHMSEAATSDSSQQSSVSSLFEEFRTSWGEVVSPYETLRLSRNAENQDIKKAYYKLMKKYHPDKVAQRDILPGSW